MKTCSRVGLDHSNAADGQQNGFSHLIAPFASTPHVMSNSDIGCCCVVMFSNYRCGNWDHEKRENDVRMEGDKSNRFFERKRCKARSGCQCLVFVVREEWVAINEGFLSECFPFSKKSRVRRRFEEPYHWIGNKRNAMLISFCLDPNAMHCGFDVMFHRIEDGFLNNLWELFPTPLKKNSRELLAT